MPKAHILVIDDDPGITQLLHEHLTTEGYEVETVHLGEEGFDRAVQSPPDLLFLDVMLPDATGFQLLGRFRQEPATQSLPIIMMSGTARHANQLAIGKSMGASAYVLKPFDVVRVGDQVKELLRGRIIPERKPKAPKPAPITVTAKPILKNDLDGPLSISEPAVEPSAPNNDLSPVVTGDVPASNPAFSVVHYVPQSPKRSFDSIPVTRLPDVTPAAASAPTPDPIPAALPLPEPAPVSYMEEPVPVRNLSARLSPFASFFRWYTLAVFVVHMLLAMLQADSHAFQAATFIAGGWALLLGLIVAACAILKITLSPQDALNIIGWSATPIVIQTLGYALGLFLGSSSTRAADFWMRPLNIFEMAALTILGFSLRRQPGGTTAKTLMAVVIVAIGWVLTASGYFRP